MNILSFLKRPKNPLIGIDIGSHTIKVVEFARSSRKGGYFLNLIGRGRLPKGSIVDGAIKDSPQIAKILTGILNNLHSRLKKAAASVSGYSVIVKMITVPYETIEEIENNLIFEAENYVPFEIEEVYLDFSPIRINKGQNDNEKLQDTSPDADANKKDKSQSKTEIYLVAAKREIVDAYAELLQNVDIIPAVIDVDGFSLFNASYKTYSGLDGINIFLDLGASKSIFNIVSKDGLLLTRDLSIGGNILTKEIVSRLNMDYEDAERIKIEGTDDRELFKRVSSIIEEILSEWISEISKAIDFFKANNDVNSEIKAMYLCGGSSLLKGIDKYFKDALGINTHIFNPFHNIELDRKIDPAYIKAIGPQFAVASGLALRMEDDNSL